jgi:DNA-binding winged helix-turn-helix (wHTH) protein
MTMKPSRYRFGIFELDVQSGEVRRNGSKLKIQEQSVQVLALLLARAGAPVTREEIRTQLWPADTFVDFDHSINAAIKRLREALSDEAENPRFIETLPRRGYRFIGPVSQLDGAQTNWIGNKFQRRFAHTFLLIAIVGALAGVAWFYFLATVESKLPAPRVVPVTTLSDRAEDPSLSPDGNEVAFRRVSDLPDVSGIYIKQIGSEHLLQLTRNGSDWCPVWSPDGRFVAFSRYANAVHEIYMVSAIGGTERKLRSGAPAHPPLSWSPDGKLIAFTAKDSNQNTYSINLLSVENLETRKLTEPGAEQQDWGPAFSPNGKELAFVRTHGALNMADIFIMSLNGGEARRLTLYIDSQPTNLDARRSIDRVLLTTDQYPDVMEDPSVWRFASSDSAGWRGCGTAFYFAKRQSTGV